MAKKRSRKEESDSAEKSSVTEESTSDNDAFENTKGENIKDKKSKSKKDESDSSDDESSLESDDESSLESDSDSTSIASDDESSITSDDESSVVIDESDFEESDAMDEELDLNDPDPENPKKWIDITRNEHEQIYINEEFEGIPAKIPGLEGIVLTGHQRRNIKAMMDLENTREIYLKGDPMKKRHIRTCGGRLSEKLGSGKTFIMLGLVLVNKCPAIHPELIRPPMYNQFNNTKKSKYMKNESSKFEGFGYHFERTYKKYLNTSIIFVSSGVLVQWEKNIKKHLPNTKYMIIDNVLRLRKFEQEVRKGTYDKEITVVKNGISTIADIKCLEENASLFAEEAQATKTPLKKPPKTLPIITSITHILDSMQLPCKRLFIDDFDSINIPRTALLPTSLFYWTVSSTNRQPKNDSVSVDSTNIKDMLANFHPLVSGITENNILHKALNVACIPEYTDHCVSLGKPIFKIYEFNNPNNNIANVLGAYNLGNAQQVREAINADSPKDAARLANIESSNPLDMLEKLLGEGKKNYLAACKILKYIKEVKKELPDMPKAKNNKYPEEDIAKLRNNIKSVPIRYKSPPIRDVLDDAELKASEVKHKMGTALDRARESLSAENCTVCYQEMKDSDIIMTKCCNNALCAFCGFEATGIPKSHNLTGSCSKCRARIGINNLIFIGKGFDINAFIKPGSEMEIVELADKKMAEQPKEEPLEKLEIQPTTKRGCIMQLVKGKNVNGRTVDVHIDKLLVGKDHLPAALEKNKRFIILSNYMEILNDLLVDFDKEKISALQLQGNSKQKDAIITEFKNHGKVLLINSERDCAGLNLQFATDLVFCHKILDHNIESQVAGRIQRMGCRHQTYIHYVMYNNEVSCIQVINPGAAAPAPAQPVIPEHAVQLFEPEQEPDQDDGWEEYNPDNY